MIDYNNLKQGYGDVEIKESIEGVKALSEIVKSELLAAQNGFVSGFKNKENYVMRIIPDISNYLE